MQSTVKIKCNIGNEQEFTITKALSYCLVVPSVNHYPLRYSIGTVVPLFTPFVRAKYTYLRTRDFNNWLSLFFSPQLIDDY